MGAPYGAPSKARCTRSTISFKGKHVLHVAKDAASPHAEEEHPVEEARSKPARTQKQLSVTKGAGASKPTAAASAKRTAASKRKAQAPVRKMPPYRTMMLSEVHDSPVGQAADTELRVHALAASLAGGTPGPAAEVQPKKVCRSDSLNFVAYVSAVRLGACLLCISQSQLAFVPSGIFMLSLCTDLHLKPWLREP